MVVALDLTPLKERLHELYPNEPIKVYGSETGVVLSGTVSSPEIVEQVLRLTKTYMPVESKGTSGGQGTGESGTGITNLMTVGNIQQVMLEVKFAEVRRDKNKDWQAALGVKGLGGSFSGAAGVGGLGDLSDGGFGAATKSLLLNFANLDGEQAAANVFVKIKDVTAALRFLEGEGLARLLAEPRLVTQSGQEASFLAGGEFPVPGTVDANGRRQPMLISRSSESDWFSHRWSSVMARSACAWHPASPPSYLDQPHRFGRPEPISSSPA